MKRTFVIGLSLILPSLVIGCGDDSSGQSGGTTDPNYGKDSGGGSEYDAPNNPDTQGQPDGPLCTTEGCDDGNPCTQDTCDPAKGCSHDAMVMNGESCGASDACTSYACSNGSCVGTNTVCDDGDPCTADSCDPASGCVFDGAAAEGQACNDGDACTAGDVCTNGTCAGQAKDCNDDNACTEDSCDSAIGCVNDPAALNGTTCDDESVCTENDVCTNGQCKGTTQPCVDSNPCTLDVCDPVTGCSHDAAAANGTSCNDGDLCTSNDVCNNGSCAGTTATCNDQNPCTADSCDSAVGCVFNPAGLDGTACNDNNICTTSDVCTNGACVGSTINCSDSNPCTVDSCDPVAGCQNLTGPADGATCDDDNVCTVTSSCSGGTCVGGAQLYCGDGNDCTQDSCDPAYGCVHNTTALNGSSCSDSNMCTSGDTCSGGVCSGTAITCDDNELCTADSCVPSIGCVYNPTPQNGVACDDQNLCTENDACMAGTCEGSVVNCDDNVLCTADSCDPATGCINDAAAMNGTTCSDQNQCTIADKCTGGICMGTEGPDLEEGEGTGDGVPDVCDNCPPGSEPDDYNPYQEDTDGVRAQPWPSFVAEDMSTGATTIPDPWDVGYSELSMPFAFSMFGTDYPAGETLYLHEFGLLTFGAAVDCQTEGQEMGDMLCPLNGVDVNLIALFWSVEVDGTWEVSHKLVGSPGSQRFVIQYLLPDPQSGPPQAIMRAVLYQGSNDIVLYASDVPPSYGSYSYFTRGVGHPDFASDPDDYAVGAWHWDEYFSEFYFLNVGAWKYTTSMIPDGTGDACAWRWDDSYSGEMYCPCNPLCDLSTGDPQCDWCVQNNCAYECVAASNVPDLGDYLSCMTGCSDQACADACDAQYPAASAAFEMLNMCINEVCSYDCGGGDIGVQDGGVPVIPDGGLP